MPRIGQADSLMYVLICNKTSVDIMRKVCVALFQLKPMRYIWIYSILFRFSGAVVVLIVW